MALVEIARFASLSEAQAAAAALRASGIHVFVQNEHYGQMEPYLQFALGGFHLWAPEEAADDARDFIDAHRDRSEPSPPTGSLARSAAGLGLFLVGGPVFGWLAAAFRRRRAWSEEP
jgi:hypothetical protein